MRGGGGGERETLVLSLLNGLSATGATTSATSASVLATAADEPALADVAQAGARALLVPQHRDAGRLSCYWAAPPEAAVGGSCHQDTPRGRVQREVPVRGARGDGGTHNVAIA